MRILEYTGLDTAGVAAQYRKTTEAIAREDFRAAEVKKLVNLGHGKFYRARQEAQRLEWEKERAELLAQRERRRTQQAPHSTTDAKPRWGTPEARWDAMLELQRRIEKSREQGGKKKQN